MAFQMEERCSARAEVYPLENFLVLLALEIIHHILLLRGRYLDVRSLFKSPNIAFDAVGSLLSRV
jgi:hypothetical protein